MHDYSLQVSQCFDDTYDAIVTTAKKMGKILDENKVMGYIHFKKKFWSWKGLPAKYTVSIKKLEDDVTEVITQVQPTMGYTAVTMNQELANSAYTEFLNKLSAELK